MHTQPMGIQRWNTVFQTLTAAPRRQVVDSLLHASPDRELRLPEAANPPQDLRDPADLRIELVHGHLPKMEQAGYIEWDDAPFRVWRGPEFEEIGSVMQALQSFEEYPRHLRETCHRLEVET